MEASRCGSMVADVCELVWEALLAAPEGLRQADVCRVIGRDPREKVDWLFMGMENMGYLLAQDGQRYYAFRKIRDADPQGKCER